MTSNYYRHYSTGSTIRPIHRLVNSIHFISHYTYCDCQWLTSNGNLMNQNTATVQTAQIRRAFISLSEEKRVKVDSTCCVDGQVHVEIILGREQLSTMLTFTASKHLPETTEHSAVHQLVAHLETDTAVNMWPSVGALGVCRFLILSVTFVSIAGQHFTTIRMIENWAAVDIS